MKNRSNRFALRLALSVAFLLTAGVIAAPAAAQLPQPGGFKSSWVTSVGPARLWSGPTGDAADFGTVPEGTLLEVVAQPQSRLQVWNPITKNYAWIDPTATSPA